MPRYVCTAAAYCQPSGEQGQRCDMPRLMVHSVSVVLLLLVGAPTLCRCQVDSLGDCFPLSVGNRWTYRYFSEFEENLRGWIDSGLASYSVVGKTPLIDSTLWLVKEKRDLTRRNWAAGEQTTYSSISDTTYFALLEERTGLHRLYRQLADPASLWYSVFPFPHDVGDTNAVNRYSTVDSNQSSMQEVAFPAAHPFIHFTFTLRRDSGIVRLAVQNLITMEGYMRADHQLLEGTVTDVTNPRQVRVPMQFLLSYAFPNPFNPSTTIRYGLPKRSQVTVTVYNTLGQKVATLVQGEKEAGYHEVKFDGTGLSSGVFFCRLQAGDFVKTRRLVLLR